MIAENIYLNAATLRSDGAGHFDGLLLLGPSGPGYWLPARAPASGHVKRGTIPPVPPPALPLPDSHRQNRPRPGRRRESPDRPIPLAEALQCRFSQPMQAVRLIAGQTKATPDPEGRAVPGEDHCPTAAGSLFCPQSVYGDPPRDGAVSSGTSSSPKPQQRSSHAVPGKAENHRA